MEAQILPAGVGRVGYSRRGRVLRGGGDPHMLSGGIEEFTT